jgi:ABC-2 type transport system permease protein
MYSLAKRNAKEILRDPINIAFGLGFPVVLLLLLTAIQASIPVSLFEIQHLSPGICVFGLSFISLFSATIISKDRSSSLLERLYTAPLKPGDFILAYTLPLIPLAIVQSAVCYIFAMILGLKLTVNLLLSLVFVIPVSLFFISLGLLFGTILNDKAVGGICGALLTNLSAWLSGTWFDLDLVGGIFKKIAYCLPFVHAVDMERAILNGNFADAMPHLVWVLAYAFVSMTAAVILFFRQMKKR